MIVGKRAAAGPGISLGPEGQGSQRGRLANGGPGHGRMGIGKWQIVSGGEIDEQAAIRGEVTTAFVNPAVEPMAWGELIGGGVPVDKLNPLAGAATENDCNWGGSREEEMKTAGRGLFHGAQSRS